MRNIRPASLEREFPPKNALGKRGLLLEDHMDRPTVEIMSQVSKILAGVKHYAAGRMDSEVYTEIRERLHDCQEILARHCDCAPIRLISGQVDDIMENFRKNTA